MVQYELIEPMRQSLNLIAQIVADSEYGNDELREIIDTMKKIATGERSEEHPELPSMVGLAAPQLGVSKRIILIDINAMSGTKANFDIDLRIIVNPIITDVSTEEELGREGCYSTGDICGAVYRSKHVTVAGLDEFGTPITYTFSDFLARIAQHEIDHLNGVRFPDRVRSPKHLHKVDKSSEFQKYREYWSSWTKYYPFEKWLTMKQGSIHG